MPVDTPGEYWRVGGVVITHLTSPQPAPAVGETVDLKATFEQVPGETQLEYRDRHADLLAYAPRMGEYVLHDAMTGGVRYTETHGGGVPGGSLLVSVEPPDAAGEHEGQAYWGLVESVADATNVSQTRWQANLSLAYLADLGTGDGEYADATAVRDALEKEGI